MKYKCRKHSELVTLWCNRPVLSECERGFGRPRVNCMVQRCKYVTYEEGVFYA